MTDDNRTDNAESAAAEMVELFEQAWAEFTELADGFSDADWEVELELPGWTVKDAYSHILGTESTLLGRTAPPIEFEAGVHVKNPIGQTNEIWVESRRSVPGSVVLAELREVLQERLDALRALDAKGWAADSWTPRGQGTYADFMEVRIFDTWMHEQDARRVLDKPGHLDGPVAEQSVREMLRALPFIVGKKAAAPQGSTVVFEVSGPTELTIPIGVDGRAAVLGEVPDDPDVTLSTDFETFVAVTGGRQTGTDALGAGRIKISGDEALGRAIVENLAFVV